MILKILKTHLQLSQEAVDELNKAETPDFNIFSLNEFTSGNEMATLLPWLLTKRNCISQTEIDLERLLCFVAKIQQGYKQITYHNKTHGSDLC